MPTFQVDVGNATYEVDAKNENEAWQLANQAHTSQPDQKSTNGLSLESTIGKLENSNGQRENALFGALSGATNIGKTLLRPLDAMGALGMNPEQRKTSISDFYKNNANPNSTEFKGGQLGAEIAGTSGIPGVLGKAASLIPAAAKFAPALSSGGMTLGPAATSSTLANSAIRAGAGGLSGGIQAGLIDPSSASTGAKIGAAFPLAAKAAGSVGQMFAPSVPEEVRALYQKAKGLGIDIPADRITNSKPLNALASSLNYVPLSGRAATEEKMISQMNQALSRTFGQDSPNVTMALRKASDDLGSKFDSVLKSNTVKVDNQFIDDLTNNLKLAQDELGDSEANIIKKQIDNLLSKSANSEIDGQAAYNIKKTLDRIGNRNTNEAYYARNVKKSLMEALNRSLGPDKAQEFATVRKQYGNMLDLENLAQNGAEGGVSVGRIANLKNIGNKDLQDIADIAAQFLKSRENPHGSAQRVFLGALGGGASIAAPAAIPAIMGGMAAGRVANMGLNSKLAKSMMLERPAIDAYFNGVSANPALRSGLLSIGANP